jgi:hypothetical protein
MIYAVICLLDRDALSVLINLPSDHAAKSINSVYIIRLRSFDAWRMTGLENGTVLT